MITAHIGYVSDPRTRQKGAPCENSATYHLSFWNLDGAHDIDFYTDVYRLVVVLFEETNACMKVCSTGITYSSVRGINSNNITRYTSKNVYEKPAYLFRHTSIAKLICVSCRLFWKYTSWFSLIPSSFLFYANANRSRSFCVVVVRGALIHFCFCSGLGVQKIRTLYWCHMFLW